jgi:hypothetical protein
LAVLALCIAEPSVALALIGGLAAFLVYAWVLYANYICVVLLLGVIVFTHPPRSAGIRLLAFMAFSTALPAALLSEPSGLWTGVVWIICLGGAALMAVLACDYSTPARSAFVSRTSLLCAVTTLGIGAVGLLGVARGEVIIWSGWHKGQPELTPEVRDVWRAVRELTPANALIFTDQTGDLPFLLEGWNLYAISGQRQLFLSSSYTTPELRTDSAARRAVLATNAAVLNGSLSPSAVPTRRRYDSFFAVVSNSHRVPRDWTRLYENGAYSLYRL